MEFNIVDTLLGFTLLGAEWVLWLLIILSIWSVAIILERFLFFKKVSINFKEFSQNLATILSEGDYDKAKNFAEDAKKAAPYLEVEVALQGLNHRQKGSKAMEGSMEGFLAGERERLDKGLVVLGTLGNNAPFIGLFGTVIGIIKAFNDLATNPAGGPSVVMSGISEALVATAVGLLVAIPAVIAFNAFNRQVKKHVANTQSLIKMIMTYQGG